MKKRYDRYQDTEIQWMPQIPSHWKLNRGKAVFVSKKTINKDARWNNVLSLTKKGVIRNNVADPIGLAPKSYDTYQLFEKDDLVFKLIDLENIATSRVGLVWEDGIMSPAYIRLKRRSAEGNIKYFYYLYYSWYLQLVYNNLGAGVRQTMTADELLNLNISVPPKEEQDQIVRYLDWKTSEIDRFVHQKKKQIKKLEEYKFTKIDELITKGTTIHAPMKESGVEWIGQIPENWDVHTIKQHFKVRKRIAGKEGYDVLSITQQGLKVKDISSNEGQMAMDYSGYQFVNPGDFAMNHMDLITGYVDLSDKFGVTSPDYRVFTLEDTDNCYPEFYLRVFQVAYKRRIFYKFGKGAANQGRWRLPQRAFYNFSIQIPPIEEQKAIEQECKRLEKNVDEMVDALKKEIDLLQELRTKIIADVVTGQIDVCNVVIPEYSRDEDTDSDDIEDDEEIEESED